MREHAWRRKMSFMAPISSLAYHRVRRLWPWIMVAEAWMCYLKVNTFPSSERMYPSGYFRFSFLYAASSPNITSPLR